VAVTRRRPNRLVVAYCALWLGFGGAALAAWNANHLQEQARKERLVQICSAIRDDREVLADVLSRAFATARRTQQLDEFIAETNTRFARFPQFCNNLHQPFPRVVLPALPTPTTVAPTPVG
jgi:hypothetical protein